MSCYLLVLGAHKGPVYNVGDVVDLLAVPPLVHWDSSPTLRRTRYPQVVDVPAPRGVGVVDECDLFDTGRIDMTFSRCLVVR